MIKDKDTIIASLDVGTSKVCALVARRRLDGGPELLGMGVAPSQGLRKGVVVNIRDVQESVRAAMDEATRSSSAFSSGVYVSVTGSHLELFNRWGSIRTPDYSIPLSYDQVDRAINAAYPAELPPDKQVVHMLPQTYAVDGLTGIRNPVGMHVNRLDVETLCVVTAAAPMQQLMHAIQNSRTKIHGMVMAGLACGEAVLTEDEKEAGVLLLEIGAGATTVAVFQGGTLRNATVLPVGGYQFTTDIALALNTSFDVAEEAKLRYGQVLHESIGDERVEIRAFGDRRTVQVERREICRYLHDRAEELLRLSHMKVQGLGYTGILPAGMVLTGGGANLPGMDTMARQIFNTPVRIGRPEGLRGQPEGLRDPIFAATTGALLWSLGHEAHRERIRQSAKSHRIGDRYKYGHRGPLSWIRGQAKKVAL
jgi:cell division protein FtsA